MFAGALVAGVLGRGLKSPRSFLRRGSCFRRPVFVAMCSHASQRASEESADGGVRVIC
jgi:hypothetical protein